MTEFFKDGENKRRKLRVAQSGARISRFTAFWMIPLLRRLDVFNAKKSAAQNIAREMNTVIESLVCELYITPSDELFLLLSKRKIQVAVVGKPFEENCTTERKLCWLGSDSFHMPTS